jgi:hypothetical protein
VAAETNQHVDALNAAIQQARRQRGHLGRLAVRVAGGETAAVGDIVATRRNNRALRTDRAEPVRNRDRWTVADVGRNGSLTVSHLEGHGQVTLSADYARAHVRLGYAATAQGHQGDTVNIGIGVVTAATTHRSLYVAATRGCDDNRILVVTDEPGRARDVLEQILTNDRADTPAVAQRQHLAAQVPGTHRNSHDLPSAEEAVAVARRALDDARQRGEPFLRPLAAAEGDLRAAEAQLRATSAALAEAPLWRRRALKQRVEHAAQVVHATRSQRDLAAREAARFITGIETRTADLQQAEHEATHARLRDRLDRLTLAPPARGLERGVGIDPPGL